MLNRFGFLALFTLLFVPVLFTPSVARAAAIISTVAGNGVAADSGDGGLAVNASLNLPVSIALDVAGNLYIADFNNHRIRKVDASTNNISTFAGTGVGAYNGDDKAATDAALNLPRGVAFDSKGNLFITDQGNRRLRKVDAHLGTISTVAGTGNSSFAGDGGQAVLASLESCIAVALDAADNIYIVSGQRVRRINAATGIITTVAGTGVSGFSGDGGPGTSAQLSSPVAVAVDGGGNVFIADRSNGRVRKLDTASGIITTYAGGGTLGDGAPAANASIASPNGLAFDPAGNLYISDVTRNKIRKVILTTGLIYTTAGAGMDNDGSTAFRALLITPTGLTVDANNQLYIAEGGANRIRFTAAGTPSAEDADLDGFPDIVEAAAGTSPTDPASIPAPGSITRRRMNDVKLSVHFGRAGSSKDTISLKGSVFTPTSSAITPQRIVLEIGGVAHGIDIDAKGKSVLKKPDSITFKMDKKNSTPTSTQYNFTAHLTAGDFAAGLADVGLTAQATTKAFPAVLIFYERIFAANANLLFSRGGRSAKTPSVRSSSAASSDVIVGRSDAAGE